MNFITIDQILTEVVDLLDNEEYSKALHFVSDSLITYRNNAKLWLYKAFVLGKLKRYYESIQCFDTSLKQLLAIRQDTVPSGVEPIAVLK